MDARGLTSVFGNVVCAVLALLAGAGVSLAQKDPGVRPGSTGTGKPLEGLTDIEKAMFREGFQRMIQLEAVCDDCSEATLGSFVDPSQANLVTKTNSSGLGIRFNGDQCSVCHNQPAVGGSGGFMVPNPQDPPNKYQPPENPMFRLIPQRKGGKNPVPSFIQQYGPIREVRFARKPDGSPDGGVHQLFTVVGRPIFLPMDKHTDARLKRFLTRISKGNTGAATRGFAFRCSSSD